MNYKIFSVLAVLLFSFAFTNSDNLDNSISKKEITNLASESTPLTFKEKIDNLYSDFKAANITMPSLPVFERAMKGYTKLEEQGKVSKEILTVVDFDLSSKAKRMWILDMNSRKVLFNTFVSHGQGTGGEFAKKFSNISNSHQSSLGFYVTAETYYGKNGLSLFIDGMEKGFNTNARKRYVVIHGADYATQDFINKRGRLGRSYGCPAVPTAVSKKLINQIKGESVVFIHKSDKNYLNKSSYLN